MSSFSPRQTYIVTPSPTKTRDFHDYADEYVIRPPYQRKSVWSKKKQQDLIDSLFRQYYVPRIVLRQVRLSEDRTVSEVIDGQQRITAVQSFFRGDLKIPDRLADLIPEHVGKSYAELTPDVRKYFDRLQFDVDIVKNIDDPRDSEHQGIATEIFWRLQQGESLNYMEVAHSRLSSLARNFVVKYSDDQTFDFERYEPIDANPTKHRYFEVIDRGNDRMQHLALLTRFLILEDADGPTDIKNGDVESYIEAFQRPDGIGNHGFEDRPEAKRVLGHMNAFYDAFKEDPLVRDGDGLKELKVEYFVISTYLLLRHLRMHYAWTDTEKKLFRDFVIDFHARWRGPKREGDADILAFSDARQQSGTEVESRDRVIRQVFFRYAEDRGMTLRTKDDRRAFSEAERIAIYRRQDGLCQQCLAEGRSQKEAFVEWRKYQADHVLPHALGGRTDVANAQVLCSYHNQSKGANA
jgi:hypothetical protein